MSGARISKQQRQAIKTTRKLVKTEAYKEGEKILKAIKAHRELTNYNR